MNNRKCHIAAVVALLVGLTGGFWIGKRLEAKKNSNEVLFNASIVNLNHSRLFAAAVNLLHTTGKLEDDKSLRECLKVGINGSLLEDAVVQVAESRGMRVVALPENERSRLKAAKEILEAYDKSAEQGGAAQPATRPESKSEASDKPQPEAEGRSR